MQLNTLTKGDTIYVLVPIKDANGRLDYRIEETAIIQCCEVKRLGNKSAFVKFKFTDYLNKRRRVEEYIHEVLYNEDYIKIFRDGSRFDDHRLFVYYFSDDRETLVKLRIELFKQHLSEVRKKLEKLDILAEHFADKIFSVPELVNHEA